ncbi:MAG TPA: metal-sensitive transcriptional regulator [Patescibacteria group bacterium]
MVQKKIKAAETNEAVAHRISRIEGQLRGIKKMIEEKKDCIGIMTQIMAVREAVSMLGMEVLKDDFVCKWEKNKKLDETYLKTIFKMN